MPVMLARGIRDISIDNVSNHTTAIMHGGSSLTRISLTERSILTGIEGQCELFSAPSVNFSVSPWIVTDTSSSAGQFGPAVPFVNDLLPV